MALDIEPTDPGPTSQPETPAESEPSLAEHEAEFGADKRPSADPEPEPEEDNRRAPQDRDEAGKFKPEKHRAAKSEARAGDVPRIQELTKKLREAEAERDALRARPLAPATTTSPAATDTVPRGTSAAPTITATAEPKIDDFQEYGDFVKAQIDWSIAEARRQDRETAQKEQESAKLTASWVERVDSAKAKYADFEQVALLAPTNIPQGSLIDAWILEDTTGADVLYTLQKDPAELRRILALPIFEQVKALSQIALRLSPTRESAVKTGAATTTPRAPAPRPPTPVRTSAMPAADEPPDPEKASLRDHENYYHRKSAS